MRKVIIEKQDFLFWFLFFQFFFEAAGFLFNGFFFSSSFGSSIEEEEEEEEEELVFGGLTNDSEIVVKTKSFGVGNASRLLAGPEEVNLEKMTCPFNDTSKEPLRFWAATESFALG